MKTFSSSYATLFLLGISLIFTSCGLVDRPIPLASNSISTVSSGTIIWTGQAIKMSPENREGSNLLPESNKSSIENSKAISQSGSISDSNSVFKPLKSYFSDMNGAVWEFKEFCRSNPKKQYIWYSRILENKEIALVRRVVNYCQYDGNRIDRDLVLMIRARDAKIYDLSMYIAKNHAGNEYRWESSNYSVWPEQINITLGVDLLSSKYECNEKTEVLIPWIQDLGCMPLEKITWEYKNTIVRGTNGRNSMEIVVPFKDLLVPKYFFSPNSTEYISDELLKSYFPDMSGTSWKMEEFCKSNPTKEYIEYNKLLERREVSLLNRYLYDCKIWRVNLWWKLLVIDRLKGNIYDIEKYLKERVGDGYDWVSYRNSYAFWGGQIMVKLVTFPIDYCSNPKEIATPIFMDYVCVSREAVISKFGGIITRNTNNQETIDIPISIEKLFVPKYLFSPQSK